jgi:hypothetical protein
MTPQQAWQAQLAEAPRVSLEYVRHRAKSIERRSQWRNAFEYTGAALGVGGCAWIAGTHYPKMPLMAAGMAWIALYFVYVGIQWYRRAGTQLAPTDAGILDTLRYQRRQLERQRDARRGNWRWWLPPVVPAYALFMMSMAIEQGGIRRAEFWLMIGWFALATGLAIASYERTARRLQREIDALDSLATPEPEHGQ